MGHRWQDGTGYKNAALTARQIAMDGLDLDARGVEFVLRAVNAHSALVAALQNMVDGDELTQVDYDQAKAALALARGEK